MTEFLRAAPTTTRPAVAEVEFPGAIEELRRLWRKYGSQDHAKDLVGLEFQEWKRDHGYPSDFDDPLT